MKGLLIQFQNKLSKVEFLDLENFLNVNYDHLISLELESIKQVFDTLFNINLLNINIFSIFFQKSLVFSMKENIEKMAHSKSVFDSLFQE